MDHQKLPPFFKLSSDVLRARTLELPLVALESTVITHGLPFPENLSLARDMENEVRGQGAVPATVGVLDGQVCVGLNDAQLERLARGSGMMKISRRDFSTAIAKAASGGTTVAGTMLAAYQAGIKVFATGGIGGVHRQLPSETGAGLDISTDLIQLSEMPMIVVCAGAKAILDLPGTLEVLETLGVPVVGYQTDEFPAFYSRSSGLPVSARVDTAEEAARIARAHWDMGLSGSVLVTAPPPEEAALPNDLVENAVRQALVEASDQKIRGQAVTPFLLKRVSELTQGHSLRANLSLLLNNARIAAQIARYFYRGRKMVV